MTYSAPRRATAFRSESMLRELALWADEEQRAGRQDNVTAIVEAIFALHDRQANGSVGLALA